MKKKLNLYNDEIDLAIISKILWNNKKKILLITIISLLLGFVYNSLIPKNYANILSINVNDNSKFTTKLNNFRGLIKSYLPEQSNETILSKFIYELKDYEEFLSTLKNSKKIKENILQIKIEDQEKELFKYVQLLNIVGPKENKTHYYIEFKWHDPDEARKILQDTLDLTINNLKILIKDELKEAFEFKKKITLNADRIRLDYLTEQSIIAKELNIIDNQIDNFNLSQPSVSLNISTADIAYYLRGYKAIDKEIEMIENRDNQNLKFIEQEFNNLKNVEIDSLEYNIYLMDIKLLKNTKSILVISILLGLIFGIIYVLILNPFSSKIASNKN